MSLKDRFDKFIDYFTEDGEEVGTTYQPKAEEPIVTPVPSVQELPQQAASTPSKDKTSLVFMPVNKSWLCKVNVLLIR